MISTHPVLLLVAALLGCQTPATKPEPTNRDLRGMADVEEYILRLESPERVRYLMPDVVVENLDLAPDTVIADVGSGPGIFSLRFALACPRGVIYAVDVEPRQLDAVRARMTDLGVGNIVPVLASYDDPHLPPNGVDLIFISDAFHHLSDRVAYTRRLQRYLKPGGRLAILEYRPGDLPVGPPSDHKLPEGLRKQELEEAGWERTRRFETHPYHEFDLWRVADE